MFGTVCQEHPRTAPAPWPRTAQVHHPVPERGGGDPARLEVADGDFHVASPAAMRLQEARVRSAAPRVPDGRGRRPRRASSSSPAPHLGRMACKGRDRGCIRTDSTPGTLVPMQDPNYKRLFSFPRSRGPPARVLPRGCARRTRPLHPRQAPRRVRRRRTAPTPRRLRVAAAPARAMAVPAGAAGVPVHRRAADGVAHPDLHEPAVPGAGAQRRAGCAGAAAGGAAGGALHRGGANAGTPADGPCR